MASLENRIWQSLIHFSSAQRYVASPRFRGWGSQCPACPCQVCRLQWIPSAISERHIGSRHENCFHELANLQTPYRKKLLDPLKVSQVLLGIDHQLDIMRLLAAGLYAIYALCSHCSASPGHVVNDKQSRPNVHDTSECWYEEQRLDHFTYKRTDERWKQRYLLHQGYWTRGGPIFFYGRLHVGMHTFSILTNLA